jgi:hypothetical protein
MFRPLESVLTYHKPDRRPRILARRKLDKQEIKKVQQGKALTDPTPVAK